jgi:hypothetical protein
VTRDQMLTQIRQSLAEAGLTLNHDLASRPRGGARLIALDDDRPAVRVTWAVHHGLYSDMRRGREALDVLDVMNLALSAVLTSLGWEVIAGAPGQPAVVIGRRTGALPVAGEARHG